MAKVTKGTDVAAIYYVTFRFSLPTSGREPEEEVEDLTKA